MGAGVTPSAPAPLAEHHQLDTFSSGVLSLDNWLRRRARPNQVSGASRTFVTCIEHTVVGYYALASGAVNAEAAPGRFRRNMPEPIPVAILARLAVDQSWQGHGLGRVLFRDGALRVLGLPTQSGSAASWSMRSRRMPSSSIWRLASRNLRSNL
jgi:GNAT superfamily N-acetyltransferase